MQKETEEQIKKVLHKAIQNRELAGANLLVRKNGQEQFYWEDGMANIEKEIPIRRNCLFRLYSQSKPITATATMILMERGEIDLCDPVSKFIPGFENQKAVVNNKLEKVTRDVCIQDLLNMTSGLVYDGEDAWTGRPTGALFRQVCHGLYTENPMNTYEIANAIGKIPLAYQPGTSFSYGCSADILGAVIEVVSGMSFSDFLEKEIFTPLKMDDTGFWIANEHKRERLAVAYANKQDGLEPYRGNHLGILNAMDRKPAFESGGAGLVSTIDDYAKFAQMLLNEGEFEGKRILKPASLAFMTKKQLMKSQQEAFEKSWNYLAGYSYGCLMRVMKNPDQAMYLTELGEYGWDGWLGPYFMNSPKNNLTILIMMQKKDAGTTSVTRKLRNLILSDTGIHR